MADLTRSIEKKMAEFIKIDRNKDGEVDYDSIILVDFDQAGYGFRMWDIQYFLRSVFENLFNNQQTFSVI